MKLISLITSKGRAFRYASTAFRSQFCIVSRRRPDSKSEKETRVNQIGSIIPDHIRSTQLIQIDLNNVNFLLK